MHQTIDPNTVSSFSPFLLDQSISPTAAGKCSQTRGFIAITDPGKPGRVYSDVDGAEISLRLNQPFAAVAFREINKLSPTQELAVCLGAGSESIMRFDLVLGLKLESVRVPGASCVSYSHDGVFMAAGTVDGRVSIWKLTPKLVPVGALKVSKEALFALSFSSTNGQLFALTTRGESHMIENLSGAVSSREYHRDKDQKPLGDFFCLAANPTAQFVACAGWGNAIRLTDISSGRTGLVHTSVGAYVRDLVWLNDHQLCVVGQNRVEVWDLPPQDLAIAFSKRQTLPGHPAMYWSPIAGTSRPLAARLGASSAFVVHTRISALLLDRQ